MLAIVFRRILKKHASVNDVPRCITCVFDFTAVQKYPGVRLSEPSRLGSPLPSQLNRLFVLDRHPDAERPDISLERFPLPTTCTTTVRRSLRWTVAVLFWRTAMPGTRTASSRRRAITVRMLPTDKLIPTADNTRRAITNTSVQSLAKSLARDGVLQPIVVRPHPSEDGKWEIRAGERRWRAAKVAGLAEIPAIVRPLDDQAAVTVTIAENLQRENLHPLEEAAAFQQALDKGHEPKALAAKLGKSVAFVLRRASLTTLTEAWRTEVLRPDSDAGRLSVAHLELISRLPAATQDVLAENSFHRVFARGFPTVEQLRRVIDDGLRTLVSMPWKLDDEGIDPKAGSCVNCPKRSGMQPALFDAEDAPANGKVSATDRCLDPCCFDRKMTAFVLGRESALRADHPDLKLVQVGYTHLSESMQQAVGDRATRLYDVRVVKASKPGAIPVMQVDGPKAGSLVYIDSGEAGGVTRNGHGKPSDTNGEHKPLTLAERRERLQKRRDAYFVRRVEKELREFTPAKAAVAAGRFISESRCCGPAIDALALVLSFGTSTRADRESGVDTWALYERQASAPLEACIAKTLEELVPVWTRRISGVDGHSATLKAADARRVCALLGMDAAAIDAEAITEIRVPKSWESESGAGKSPDGQARPGPLQDEANAQGLSRPPGSMSRNPRARKGGAPRARRTAKRR